MGSKLTLPSAAVTYCPAGTTSVATAHSTMRIERIT